MSRIVNSVIVLSTALFLNTAAHNQTSAQSLSFDVIDYNLRLEPDIDRKSINGKQRVKLVARTSELKEVEFNCGELTIDAVTEKGSPQKFVRRESKLIISLARPIKTNELRELEIDYHGTPRLGIRFFPDRQQVYTVFSTSQWMVCVDAPEDKATIVLALVLPPTLTAVANGSPAEASSLPSGKVSHVWIQRRPIPTYIFGFAVGKFRTTTESYGDHLALRYMSDQYSDAEMRRIFRDTRDMLEFYESRAGVRYADSVYTQVLAAGGVEQEMSSFTALRETYGREVLANEREIWLGAHEFAHQWWGNMVTCRDWTHFWLNEGMASFMASAYKEHRFGRKEYLRDIEEYRANYEKVHKEGKDRSLVFPDWNNPTAADRTLVYDKGAYVLHLLREEMGERAFWRGIRNYTRSYFGKSVTSRDFQRAMQEVSRKDLTAFFGKWVYLTK